MRGELHGKLGVRKRREYNKRPDTAGARSSLKNKKISHVFTIDTLLEPAAWSL